LKLEDDIKEHGLSVIVVGEWYNIEKMKSLEFTDQNTQSLWSPQTGGANIPALNELLSPFGIEFGDYIFKGNYDLMGKQVFYAYGSSLNRFPAGGHIVN
jgi:membrane-bound transcription factor site-1 protease